MFITSPVYVSKTPGFMSGKTSHFYSPLLRIKKDNKIKVDFKLFSQTMLTSTVQNNISDALKGVGFDNKTIQGIDTAMVEQCDNLLVYGCHNGERRVVTMKMDPDLASHIINIKGEINTSLIKMNLTGPYNDHLVKNASGDGGHGISLTRKFTDIFNWSVYIGKSLKSRISTIYLEKSDPYKNVFENDDHDYFMGKWEFYSESKHSDNALNHITEILKKLNYHKSDIFYIRLGLSEGFANSLKYGCWNRKDIPKTKQERTNVISFEWRINSQYAQFIIGYPGPDFNPLEAAVNFKTTIEYQLGTMQNRGRGIYFMQNMMDLIIYNISLDENGEKIENQLILGAEKRN